MLLNVKLIAGIVLDARLVVNKAGLSFPTLANIVHQFPLHCIDHIIQISGKAAFSRKWHQSSKSPTVHSDICSTPSPRIALTGIAASLPFHAFLLLLG